MKGKRYTLSAYWLLIVAIGTVINILLITIFGTSLPIGSHIAWSSLYTGMVLSTPENSIFTVAAVFMALFITLPFIICFIQAMKGGRALLLGLIIYALDTLMLLADMLAIKSLAVGIFLLIALVIHAAGLVLLGYGYYHGSKDAGGRSAVRMLYIRRAPDGFASRSISCQLNGAFMCDLEPREEKLVVIDNHRQRLLVTAYATESAELLLPSGGQNVSVILAIEYINGQSKIRVLSAEPSAK